MSYFYNQLEEKKKHKDENDDTPYEAEDVGCDCTEEGMESEWEWDKSQQAYVCNGCGEVQ